MFLGIVFTVYFGLISISNAVLTTKPKNTVSLKGKRVEFKCRRENSSDSQNPIDWSFASVGVSAPRQFYFNGKFSTASPYSSWYKVLRNEPGQCDLIIDSVDFSYAGNYKCTSKTSGNKIKSYSAAELVVLDSDPICEGSFVNDSEEYEIIEAKCHINYRGNAKPRMECTANDDRAIINITLTVNYTESTYRDNTTLTNITSSVMTSSFAIPKAQNTTITCNITFILFNSSNIDDKFEYFHLWTYAPKNQSRDNADGKGNEYTASSPYIVIIVSCVLGTLCVIFALLLMRMKFCNYQKKRMSRNSEPDVLLPIQLYGESTQYEEVQLQDRPCITTDAAASSFDVHGEDVSCETGINAKDGKAKLESGKKKSASYSVVHKKTTASKTKKKAVVTGADGTVYTEVSLSPGCGKIVPPSDSPRSAVHRVQNYVPVDHTWKCLPAPPKI